MSFAIRERVKQELKEMVKKDIIAPVTEPTAWVNQMVVAKKKDKDALRICIDPKDLNDALLRPHHPMHTIEGIVARTPGANYFPVIDAKTGFDENSSFYTTFNTPCGRYRFKRMPCGIKPGISAIHGRVICPCTL